MYFCIVNVITKRHIASWVLLAVYLPMLLLSSLHIHETSMDGATECAECVKHQCHGHLIQLSDGVHQCVLCQILTLSYVASATGALLYVQPNRSILSTRYCQVLCPKNQVVLSLRAPPAA